MQKETNKKDLKAEFKRFWVKACKKYNLDKSLDLAVWLHFKEINITKSEEFISGLKNFGFKIKE